MKEKMFFLIENVLYILLKTVFIWVVGPVLMHLLFKRTWDDIGLAFILALVLVSIDHMIHCIKENER